MSLLPERARGPAVFAILLLRCNPVLAAAGAVLKGRVADRTGQRQRLADGVMIGAALARS